MAKILLAEDDNDMRRFLVKALENAGFQVSSHDNGMAAYQRLREEPFEMLLTDIVMPEMDGIELARRASELDPDIKIMFITGFAAVALNPDSACISHTSFHGSPIVIPFPICVNNVVTSGAAGRLTAVDPSRNCRGMVMCHDAGVGAAKCAVKEAGIICDAVH